MHQPGLSGRDTSKPRARGGLSLAVDPRGNRPRHPILQPSSDATAMFTYHARCQGQLATLSHVTLSCPVSPAVWQWFAATWAAITQQPAPPLHADLLLADDRRGPWHPAADLVSLWQRLHLLVITQLWVAYCRCRSQPEQPTLPAHIAARVISAAKDQMRSDWLLVGSDIRLRAGVLSHWLRGRQPSMTAEAFQSRWCHGEVLCSRPAEEQEPPRMHWSAAPRYLASRTFPHGRGAPRSLPVIPFAQSIFGSIFWQSGCRMHSTWCLGLFPTCGVHLGLSVLHHSSLASHLYPHSYSKGACCISHRRPAYAVTMYIPQHDTTRIFLRKKPYMSAQLANCSNINRQI